MATPHMRQASKQWNDQQMETPHMRQVSTDQNDQLVANAHLREVSIDWNDYAPTAKKSKQHGRNVSTWNDQLMSMIGKQHNNKMSKDWNNPQDVSFQQHERIMSVDTNVS